MPLIPLSLRGLQHFACRFISSTHIQLITNTAILRLSRLLFPPCYFLYCREGILRVLEPPLILPCTLQNIPRCFFSKPTSGAFCTKVLFHAFGNKDFVICFFILFFLRWKSLSLQKYSSKKLEQYFRNTLRAWHRSAFGSFVLFAPPFCEVGFSKCF